MCGIVGVIGARPAAPLLLEALRRLEYRGYDSAGIATLVDGHIDRRRASGKLVNLTASLDREGLAGPSASATRGGPRMARPPRAMPTPTAPLACAIVHNGIIENHAELRAELEAPASNSIRRQTPKLSRYWSTSAAAAAPRRLKPPWRRCAGWKAHMRSP